MGEVGGACPYVGSSDTTSSEYPGKSNMPLLPAKASQATPKLSD